MRFAVVAYLVSALAAMTGAAQAAPVLGLYNTGVDAAGNVLAAGSVDSHYQVYSSGFDLSDYLSGYSAGSFVGSDTYVPTGFDWGINTPTRAAISFSNGTGSGYQAFTYRTTFDLSGYDINDVTINYDAYFDDGGMIAVNGVLVPSTYRQYVGPTLGSISGVFSAGINTIDFVTFNEGGAGGMMFSVTSISGVPEVGTLALLGSGLLLLGVFLARRRNTTLRMTAAA